MSLYNSLLGINKLAPAVISELFDLKFVDGEDLANQCNGIMKTIPRFRDAFVNEAKELVLYTHTGGNNRVMYEERSEENKKYNGLFNKDLKNLPGFLRTYDGTFDSTFAYFVYAPHSEEFKLMLDHMDPSFYLGQDPEERMQKLLEAMKTNDMTNPDLAKAQPALLKLGEAIKNAVENPNPNSNITILET